MLRPSDIIYSKYCTEPVEFDAYIFVEERFFEEPVPQGVQVQVLSPTPA
jgi:hypothetical protein